MKDKINKMVDSLKDELINDLRELIKIPSKKSEAKADAPYGENCKKALEKAIKIGSKKGFTTKNIDNRVVYCSIGESSEYICAMGHLDVVDEMPGWKYPPFEGEIHDNKIYARGALDNKGPIMAAFFGLYTLKKLGVEFNREFRIVFGSDEESGMSDLKYYLTKEKPPIMGFSPDNKFPAIYGERARAKIEVKGNFEDFASFLNNKILAGDPVKNLDIDISDEDFGRMILRGKKIFRNESEYGLEFSLSMPVCDIDLVMKKIKENSLGLKTKLISYEKAFLEDKDSHLVQILNDAYNDFTGENQKPTTTTGMTYAHFCPNIIPFGPSFPGQNGIAHLPNEWMDIDDLLACTKIYAYAFYKINESFNKGELNEKIN